MRSHWIVPTWADSHSGKHVRHTSALWSQRRSGKAAAGWTSPQTEHSLGRRLTAARVGTVLGVACAARVGVLFLTFLGVGMGRIMDRTIEIKIANAATQMISGMVSILMCNGSCRDFEWRATVDVRRQGVRGNVCWTETSKEAAAKSRTSHSWQYSGEIRIWMSEAGDYGRGSCLAKAVRAKVPEEDQQRLSFTQKGPANSKPKETVRNY